MGGRCAPTLPGWEMRTGPRKGSWARDAAQGLQHSDNHGDIISSTCPLISIPTPLGVTDLAHPAPASENYEKEGGSLPRQLSLNCWLSPYLTWLKTHSPRAQGQEGWALASALTAHAWLPLSLAHNMPFSPWHKLFPLLCLAFPWLTHTHREGEWRS